jgi:hypothetical protein
MIDRAADVPPLAVAIYYGTLAVLFWGPATVISWTLEDLWHVLTYDPRKELHR